MGSLPGVGSAKAASAAPAQVVTLGDSVVALTGPWKFRTGDDMRFADANFDDSAWGAMDLTPLPGSYDPQIGSSGYVPGWTARGYRGYSGYALVPAAYRRTKRADGARAQDAG
jgi:hypothetical protein